MPSPVDRYFKEVKKGNPSYSDEQAWATAWSIYCKNNPGSEHCHKGKEAMKTAADTTKEEWEKALKEDEANLAKMEKALKFLQGGKPVPGDPHWSLATAKKLIEGLKEVIQNKKQLISKLASSDHQAAEDFYEAILVRNVVARAKQAYPANLSVSDNTVGAEKEDKEDDEDKQGK